MARTSFNILLNKLLGGPSSVLEKFHYKTKIKALQKNLLLPSKWPVEWKTVFFKEYPRLDKIILPEPKLLGNISLEAALRKRQSERNFSRQPVSLDEISTLLFYSAGLRNNSPPHYGNRFYPSAGARYPLEVYLISLNSELTKGVYHYNLRSHSLEILRTDVINLNSYFNQNWIKRGGLVILFSACFERTSAKYGDRGYRHVLAETGMLTQNLYLLAQALRLAVCGVGGYDDDRLNQLLDIDGVKESVIQVTIIAKKV